MNYSKAALGLIRSCIKRLPEFKDGTLLRGLCLHLAEVEGPSEEGHAQALSAKSPSTFKSLLSQNPTVIVQGPELFIRKGAIFAPFP
jgi:hypothetical protein